MHCTTAGDARRERLAYVIGRGDQISAHAVNSKTQGAIFRGHINQFALLNYTERKNPEFYGNQEPDMKAAQILGNSCRSARRAGHPSGPRGARCSGFLVKGFRAKGSGVNLEG